MNTDKYHREKGTNQNGQPILRNVDNWYEVRVDSKKVAAFGPISQSALEKSHELIKTTRYDLYKDKVLQIVLVNKVQTRDEHGRPSFTRNGLREEIVHEEHPTVWEFEAEGKV